MNSGINDLDRIRKGVKAANIMSGVYAVLVYGLVYIALPYIVPLFISEQIEMVCGYARTYITICGNDLHRGISQWAPIVEAWSLPLGLR